MKTLTLEIVIVVPDSYPTGDVLNDIEAALERGEESMKDTSRLVHDREGCTWDIEVTGELSDTPASKAFDDWKWTDAGSDFSGYSISLFDDLKRSRASINFDGMSNHYTWSLWDEFGTGGENDSKTYNHILEAKADVKAALKRSDWID